MRTVPDIRSLRTRFELKFGDFKFFADNFFGKSVLWRLKIFAEVCDLSAPYISSCVTHGAMLSEHWLFQLGTSKHTRVWQERSGVAAAASSKKMPGFIQIEFNMLESWKAAT